LTFRGDHLSGASRSSFHFNDDKKQIEENPSIVRKSLQKGKKDTNS
jgi:hypothetical protein